MTFVEDQQTKHLAQPLHVNAGAVVSRHRDRSHAIRVVADDPGVEAQALQDPAMPLIHQVAHRRDDQRADRRLLHDRQRDLRFAGPSRHHDDPLLRCHPTGHSRRLVGSQCVQFGLRPRHLLPQRHFINERPTSLSQSCLQLRILQRIATDSRERPRPTCRWATTNRPTLATLVPTSASPPRNSTERSGLGSAAMTWLWA